MLYLSKLEVCHDSVYAESPFGLTTQVMNLSSMRLRLTLKDSDTGKKTVIHNSDYHTEDFLREMRRLSPYGVVEFFATYASIAFVVIDESSLEFLNCVESVIYLAIPINDKRRTFCARLKGEFLHIDKDMSLFTSNGLVCTLYHAMCSQPKSWYGDEYYLFSKKSMNKAELGYDFAYLVYRIRFCDVQLAKRYMTKALTLDFNPVGKEIAKLADFEKFIDQL